MTHSAVGIIGVVLALMLVIVWLSVFTPAAHVAPHVMVALPNTGGALCSTLQSSADAHH